MIDLKDIEDIEPFEGEKPEIEIPFVEKKTDVGEWVYTHQVGLFATLILYLLLMIFFVTFRISVEVRRPQNVIAIDVNPLEELQRERDELIKSLEKLKQDETIDWEEVDNQISNESSTETESEEIDIEQMLADAEANMRQMEANRADYERILAEAQEVIDNPPAPKPFLESREKRRDIRVGGSVTVSYTLDNPIRHAQDLVVPAYLCEGGGKVSIRIAVNQRGEVIYAKVISGGDECMQQSALNSALASRFDINRGAPLRHMGLIIYTFVPQQR